MHTLNASEIHDIIASEKLDKFDATPPVALARVVSSAVLALAVLAGGACDAAAGQREDIVEITDASYPIIKQLTAEKFQPFIGKVTDLLLQAKELDATIDAGLDWFNSIPDAKVAATTDAVKAAFDGLDPASCAVVPLPSAATFDKVVARAAGADAGKLKTFADRAAPVVKEFVRNKDDPSLICLPPMNKLEAAALAQADAANAANLGAGMRFNVQASKAAATAPKGPLLQLFTGYDGAKQTLGATREERARFQAAGKRAEVAATAFSRQAQAMQYAK